MSTKTIDIELDRAWTGTVAAHVRSCGHLLQFLESQQDGFVLDDVYRCQGCHQVLLKEASKRTNEESMEQMIRHSLLKKAALGISIDDIHEQIIVGSASESEIAATLEEEFKSKMIIIEVDREWTRTVAQHVTECGANLEFVRAEQNGFELVDQYRCQKCGETLTKRASRDVHSTMQSSLLMDELNRNLLETLAKDPPAMPVLQCYRFFMMSNTVCPTVEQMNDSIAAFRRESNTT